MHKHGGNIKFSFLLILSFIIILCLSCSQETNKPAAPSSTISSIATGPRYGGIMRVGHWSDSPSFGYILKTIAPSGTLMAAPAIESLFRNDKTGKEMPWLASGYKQDAATKTITITLNKGIKFHDSTDFNAEAAKWNIEQAKIEKIAGTNLITSIDIVDDYTIRINLSSWNNTIISTLTQNAGGMISQTAYKKNGMDWCADNPVGTGPFKFVSHVKDVKTVYTKFADYWQKGKPYLDGIEMIVIADPLTRELAFRNKELDVIIRVAEKPVSELSKEGYNVSRGNVPGGAWNVVPSSANAISPWSNIKVRQAAAYAVDTKMMVEKLRYGLGEATNQWGYKDHWGYNPSVVGYAYNSEKAKQLLAEAGYPNGFKTVIYNNVGTWSDDIIPAVQAYYKTVGINAEVENWLAAKYQSYTLKGGAWEGVMWGVATSNPDLALNFLNRYAGDGMNFVSMLFPEDYKQAILNSVAAPTFEEKQKFVQEAQKLMIDKYCLILPLYGGLDLAVSQKYLHNHGFLQPANSTWFTPEDAWLEAK